MNGTVIANMLKSSTFAIELIREFFCNSHNLLVISFSVINYVVSMRRPRVSGEVSFFLYILEVHEGVAFGKPCSYGPDIVHVMHVGGEDGY